MPYLVKRKELMLLNLIICYANRHMLHHQINKFQGFHWTIAAEKQLINTVIHCTKNEVFH